MKIILTCASFMVMATQCFGDDLSPWFGSEASPPAQIVLAAMPDDTSQVSEAAISLASPEECPIEGCPPTKKLGK
jgi:hypothetical protein